jgi:branched-chain amino acid transport system substrate-binding protein
MKIFSAIGISMKLFFYRFVKVLLIASGLLVGLFSAALMAENNSLECATRTATKEIRLGMSTALSGPSQYLGNAMLAGVRQALNEANCDAYWIAKNTRFKLFVLDDSYEPTIAAANSEHLINKQKVIALIGNVGTPTAERSWKIANDAKVIFYGAYTGANVLRHNPPAAYVFNYRASYDQEMKTIIDEILTRGISIKRIGIFLQQDAFGAAGLAAAHKVLEAICNHCKDDIFQMHYERNSLKINDALKTFIGVHPKPKAIILVGGSEPSADFIRFAHRLSPDTQFFSLSFTGASALSQRLLNTSAKVYMSQVIPAQSSHTPITPLNEVAQEGYLATELLLAAARNIKSEINSETLRQSLQLKERQLNPTSLLLDQQMSDLVWLKPLNIIAKNTPSDRLAATSKNVLTNSALEHNNHD